MTSATLGLSIWSKGRPDDRLHGFGEREIMLIVQGAHGYISPRWYAPGATRAPTWNFTTAHCYGVPQVLDEETNLRTIPASPMRCTAHSPPADGSLRGFGPPCVTSLACSGSSLPCCGIG
jgi:Putative FMN-binding domain